MSVNELKGIVSSATLPDNLIVPRSDIRRDDIIDTRPDRRPANVRPAYQNTSDAMDIAVKALQLAASNATLEGAPPALVEKLRSQGARLSAHRIEVMKGNPA